MPSTGKLRAWIEPGEGGRFIAAFISVAARPGIRPATRSRGSWAEARQLVEELAASINFQLEWVDPPPHRVSGGRPLVPAVAIGMRAGILRSAYAARTSPRPAEWHP